MSSAEWQLKQDCSSAAKQQVAQQQQGKEAVSAHQHRSTPSGGSKEEQGHQAPGKRSHGSMPAGTKLKLASTGCTSNKVVIAKLEQELHQKLSIYSELAEANSELKAKERVLLENVTAQGDNLHFVALATFQEHHSRNKSHVDAAVSNMLASLMQDVKAHEMLSIMGSTGTPDEPYTTKCMRTAFTPERVEQVRKSSLGEVVAQLRSLTLQLSVILHMGPECPSSMLSRSLDDLVDDYTELAMLMHVVSDKANLELGVLNLDTMQEQEPPEGHWQRVLSFLELRQDQIQHLRTGFQVYQRKTKPLVEASHELVRQMQQIIFVGSTDGSADACAATSPSSCDHSISAQRTNSGTSVTAATVASAVAGESLSGAASRAASGVVSSSDPAASAQQRAAALAATTSAAAMTAMQSDEPPAAWVQSAEACTKPWQELGLPTGGLTVESADQLDSLMCKLLDTIMKLRELHRTITFLWINTLDKKQKAISIVKSYPFWSQTLTMLKHLLENQTSSHSWASVQEQQEKSDVSGSMQQ